jgi:hypothetical protein
MSDNPFDKLPKPIMTCRWCNGLDRAEFAMIHTGLCPDCQRIDDPTRCFQCDARYGGGEPFHLMTVTLDSGPREVTVNQYRCSECIDEYSRASWPDEWGPYPGMPIPVPKGRPS